MGLCAACFIRDTAGALGLHHNVLLQYARPEVVGVILGAFVLALARREFVPLAQRTGSAPVTRFVLGFTMMIGALIFLGCPLRMLLRIAGGDLNALVGLFGFIAGILIGLFFIKRGFSLGQRKAQKQLQEQTEKQAQSMAEGGSINVAALILLAVMVFVPSLLLFSAEGLGSMYAPLGASLLAGLAVGAASFFSRFCIVGAFRDSFLLKKVTPTLLALCVLLVVAALGNLVLGSFNLGFEGQPVAHTEGLWNFLGLALVGLSAVLVSGCPMRQLVLAGGGSSDATLTIAGMMAAAAIAHNFQIAATPAGVSNNGMLGFGLALAATLAIAVIYTFSAKRKQANSDDSQAEEGTVKTKPRLTGLCAQAHNGEHE
jgi:YedE family putative selenium metabolism protein